MTRRITDLIAPPACVACRSPGSWPLCGACRRALPYLDTECCGRCGLPAPCGLRCPAARAAFSAAWSPLAHDGPARSLVLALKYRSGRALGPTLAAPMIARAPPGVLDRGAVLVPVPADPGRARRRGYNQATVIAEVLAARLGVEVSAALRSLASSSSKVGTGRTERARSASLNIPVLTGAAPLDCVLVDDVHTTGATLDACARALRLGGATNVSAVTATRTLAPSRGQALMTPAGTQQTNVGGRRLRTGVR